MKMFHDNSKNEYGMYFEDHRGVISLFLCLMLAVLIPIIFTIISAARFGAMKVQIECATDMAMDSVLAEYNQILLSRYDLLFVDMAYSGEYGSPDNTADHLMNYMEYNLGPNGDGGKTDLFGLTADSVDITRVSRATDNGGEVFRYMAVSYMLEHYGYSYVESADDMITQAVSANLMDRDMNEDLASGRTDLENIDYESEEDSGSDFEEITIDDPTLSINEATGDGILALVYKGDVSETSTDLSLCVSGRDLVNGDGTDPTWKDYNDVLDELLFNEYIMLHCGTFGSPKESCLLSYQTEYIISGNNNDKENLKSVVSKILIMRYGANMITYLSSPVLMTECAGLATTLTVLFPPAQPVVEALLSAAWVYGESIHDLKVILGKGKIPLIKTYTQWALSLEDVIFSFADVMNIENDYSSYNQGLSYDDYLRILLYLTPSEDKTKRCMDIVEMDVRHITGRNSFMLDNCAASFQVQAIIVSSYGYEFLVKKDFGYR